ncbi:MAG: RidA family protein [Candidatus Thorarchaeota archaeon]
MKLIDIDSDAKKNSKAHYSAAVVHNGIVYVSGQLPIDPKTGIPSKGGIKDQTRAVFRNLTEVLALAGSSKERILRTTAYIPDVSLWGEVNEVYVEYFGNYKPARTVVPTTKLHYGCLIEIDAIAFIDE